jgi:hypothetical protein
MLNYLKKGCACIQKCPIQLLKIMLLLTATLSVEKSYAKVYPFQFSITEEKIVKTIPKKERDFAFIIPRKLSTYIYSEEADYYADYQRSYFAITRRKGGWDCMRHYEILANGCIPYFDDLDKCNPNTMCFLPKELILEAMNLPGVSRLKINHRKFNKDKYYEILNKLLDHTRKYLTAKSMAAYLLDTMHYTGTGKILFLSNDPGCDYTRCVTLGGLKQLLGERVIDVPKIEHIYKSYAGNIKELYGKGFSYTRVVEDFPVDRENIEERIKNKEFDLVIYGSVHRGLRYYDLVRQTYEEDKIIYICGEDNHKCEYAHLPHLFLREFDAL